MIINNNQTPTKQQAETNKETSKRDASTARNLGIT